MIALPKPVAIGPLQRPGRVRFSTERPKRPEGGSFAPQQKRTPAVQELDLDKKVDAILDEIDALRRAIRCVAPFTADAVPTLAKQSDQAGGNAKPARPALPEPRLVRHIIRMRRARIDHFGAELFADPVWDMLLELTAAQAEHRRVTIKVLCLASGVPNTTALRWIHHMSDQGLIIRSEDDTDKRRVFVSLSDRGMRIMADYFADLIPFAQYAI